MQILVKPILTEKASGLSEKRNCFTFHVNVEANKIQIKNAVEKAYGVSVLDVNTMVVDGKVKSRHTKTGFVSGRSLKYKKAFVYLRAGETIDYYANI